MPVYLGQHFLVSRFFLKKIVDTLQLEKGDFVVEIGPGHGELTEEFRIPNLEFRVIAVEKDRGLTKGLRKKFAHNHNKDIKIITGDILKILLTLPKSSYKLVGNIPFYITGRLLRTLSELKYKPLLIVLTIQKEVAQRIIAQPPKMNLLAASVQFWAEPKIIDYIPKKYFKPQPKVDSAIIKLSPQIYADETQTNAEKYYKLIKILFKQPRKTILNNLINIKRADFPKIDVNIWRLDLQKLLKKTGINPNDRPQNLTIEQITNLSTLL